MSASTAAQLPLRDVPVTRGSRLGNLLAFRSQRLELLQRMAREYGDVCWIRVGPEALLFVSGAEYVHSILVEHAESFIKSRGLQLARPALGNGLLTSEHDYHRRQRKLISPGLQHRRIRAFADVMASYAERMQAGWQDGTPLDVSAQMLELTLSITAKTLFNSEVAEEAREIGDAVTVASRYVISEVTSIIKFPLTWPTPRNLRLKRAIARLDRTVYRMIRERRASGQDPGDLLSMLLSAQEEGSGYRMTDVEVRDEAMTLFLAGHETTANALTWALYLLAGHPRVQRELEREVDEVLGGRLPTFDDLPRLPFALQVFKETMRLYPPAYLIGRQAERDVTVGDVFIPGGATLFVNVYGMHRRPDYFPGPDDFSPERWKPEAEKLLPRSAYAPFGGGPRVCIGNQFALMEGQIVLAALAQRFRFERVDDRPPVAEPLITLRPLDGISLRPKKRLSA
jgi:cytochrome P450